MPPHGAYSNNSIKASAAKGPFTRGGVDAVKAGAEATKKELEAAVRQEKKAAEDARAMVEDMKIQLNAVGAQLEIAQAEIRAMKSEATRAARDIQLEATTDSEPVNQSVESSMDSARLCGSIFETDNTSNIRRLWPNGQVLAYRFIDGHPNQHAKVTEVILEWSRFANITFKLFDEENPLSGRIIISFKSAWGCWGYIGADVLSAMDLPFTMALGAVSESRNLTQSDRAIILHQFGHALGLVHEHISPSETDAVALKEDLISKYYSSRNTGVSMDKCIDTYVKGSVTNYVVPDLSSVMVYAMPGEFNEGNFTIEPNATLSPLDKAFMVINYPRPQTHDEASEWTLRHALVIVNVDEVTSRLIIEEQDITKRRILFANYISSSRRQNSAALVDPAAESVLDLTLPAVQDVLRGFFENIDSHPEAQDMRADPELMQKLDSVLGRLASHQIVREVVQRALPTPPPPTLGSFGNLEVDEGFVSQLVEVIATFYAAINPPASVLVSSPDDAKVRQVDAVTALCNELARHANFQHAMERAIGKDVSSSAELAATSSRLVPALSSKLGAATMNLDDVTETLDVSGIVAQLSTRPAILGAVRRALIG